MAGKVLLAFILFALACCVVTTFPEPTTSIQFTLDTIPPSSQNYPLWWAGAPPNVLYLAADSFNVDNLLIDKTVSFHGAIDVDGRLVASCALTAIYGNSSSSLQVRLSGSLQTSESLAIPRNSQVIVSAPSVIHARYYFVYSDITLRRNLGSGTTVQLYSLRPLIGSYNLSATDDLWYNKGQPGKVYVYACKNRSDLSSCRTLYQNLSFYPSGSYWRFSLRMNNVQLNNEYLVYIAVFSDATGSHAVTLSSFIDLPLLFAYWRLSNGTIIKSNPLQLTADKNLGVTPVYQFLYGYLAVSTDTDAQPSISGTLASNYSLVPGGVHAVPSEQLLGLAIPLSPQMAQGLIEWCTYDTWPSSYTQRCGGEYVNERTGSFFSPAPFSYELKASEHARKYSSWIALKYSAYFDWYYNFGSYYSTYLPIILASSVSVPQLFNLSLSDLSIGIPRNAWGIPILPESSLQFHLTIPGNDFKKLVYNGSTSGFLSILGTFNTSDILEVYSSTNENEPLIIANPGLVYYMLRAQRPASITVYKLNLSSMYLVSSVSLRDIVTPSWLSAHQSKPLSLSNVSAGPDGKLYTVLYLRLKPGDQVYALSVSYKLRLQNFTDYFFVGWSVYEAAFSGDSCIPHHVYFNPSNLVASVPSSSITGVVTPGKVVLLVARYSRTPVNNHRIYILKGPPGISLLPFNETHFLGLPRGSYLFLTNATLWLMSEEGRIIRLENASGMLLVHANFGKHARIGSRQSILENMLCKDSHSQILQPNCPAISIGDLPELILNNNTKFKVLAIQASCRPGRTILVLNGTTYIYESAPVDFRVEKVTYNETSARIFFSVQPLWEGMYVVALYNERIIGFTQAENLSLVLPYSSFPDDLAGGNLSLILTWGGNLAVSDYSLELPVVRAIPLVVFRKNGSYWKATWKGTLLSANARNTQNVPGKLVLQIANGTRFLWGGSVKLGEEIWVPEYDLSAYSLFIIFVPNETKEVVVVPWIEKL